VTRLRLILCALCAALGVHSPALAQPTSLPSAQPTALPTSSPTTQPTTEPSADAALVRPSAEWARARAAEAEARLSTTEAGRLVWAAIEAHGGLERWFANGPLAFRFSYRALGGRPPTDTYQIIDTWSSRAWHRDWATPEVTFGWDGARAWYHGAAEPPLNVRFWSLTPYYFVAIPFVLADPGVQLAHFGELDFEGRTYDEVLVTYEAGVGDSPGDYYIVLIDRETRRIGGCRYIVAYPGFFPEGGHTAEKLMVYDGAQVVDGITFPETFRTFAWNAPHRVAPGQNVADGALVDPVGELVTESTMSDVSFEPELREDRFAPPVGATIVEGY
jgi:hypothetical protein